MQPGSPRHARIPSLVALGAILLGGCALAAYQLGRSSLWLDETYTWWFSRMGLAELLNAARIDGVNPPLYYILVWGLRYWAGESEGGLRAASVIAHGATIMAMYALGKQLGGRLAGLAAAAIWALHPMALWYARDARPYALAAFLSALLLWLYLRFRERPSRGYLVAGGLAMAAGLMTHYFFFVVVGSLLTLAATEVRGRPRLFRQWSIAALLAMVPLALWLLWFFSLEQPSLGIGWIDPPTFADLPATLWNLVSGFGGRPSAATSAFGMFTAALLVACLLEARSRRWRLTLLAILVLMPMVTVWMVSQRRPVYVDRYFILLLPLVVGLAGAGVASISTWLSSRGLGSGWTGAVLAGLILVIGGAAAHRIFYHDAYAKEDWRGLAASIAPAGQAQEAVWRSEPEILLPLAYYLWEPIPLVNDQTASPCRDGCWYVTRKPYTATHAFGQSVQEPDRPWTPSPPNGCTQLDAWISETGLAAFRIVCGAEGS